ncbi:MAG: alpha-isopropylmalate synthase regulatory domain-containing protein [Candidatus Limnocylindrales bacterium]|nr:alpha-isopropylmalate synthase regulatory domain-containing protein [Candidatus Limnocylindrales bacterium]
MSEPGLAPRPEAEAPDGRAESVAPGTSADAPGDQADSGLHLRRWTMTTGSGSERSAGSRAAVVLAAGDSQWEGTAESAGAIGAVFGALDAALEDVLGGRVRLVAFDVHAIGETAAADALVELLIEPPAGASGERAAGRYPGSARDVSLVAACAAAYLAALRALLADDAWAGAMAAAGNDRLASVRAQAARSAARAEIDADAALDSADWFSS